MEKIEAILSCSANEGHIKYSFEKSFFEISRKVDPQAYEINLFLKKLNKY